MFKPTFALVMLSFFSVFNAKARTWQEIKKSGVISMATEGVAPPFNFYKGQILTGFEVQLAEEFATALGLKVKWKTLAFDALLIGLDKGNYDVVVASHAITEQRKKAVEFIDPHYCSGSLIVSLKGGPKTLDELNGKTLAAQLGSIYPKMLESMKKFKQIKALAKDTDLIQSVLEKKVDAAITDKFLALEIIRKRPELNRVLSLGEIINTEENAMAVKKENLDLKHILDEQLRNSFKNGVYERLSQSYFSQDIRCRSKP